MTTADLGRIKRIATVLDRAIAEFRNSDVRATVGDIETEQSLGLIRDELDELIRQEKPRGHRQ